MQDGDGDVVHDVVDKMDRKLLRQGIVHHVPALMLVASPEPIRRM